MIKTGKKDLVWSFLSTFASYGISLILTPIIVIYLPTEELGLWYTFASIAVIMDMLDLGFAAALRRNITYSWMGAKELIKEGCPVIQGDKPNLYLFVKIYEATRIIRIFVSIIGALLLTIFGSIYISYVMRDYSGSSYLIAWLIYSGSLAIGSFFAYISIVYEGTGNIAISQKGILIGKFTQVVSAIIFVICGYGIIGLSIGFLIAEIAKRIYYWYVFEKIVITKSQIKKINKEIKRGEIKEIIRIIWFNAKKVGFSSICTSIMSQLGTLICSGILGVTTTATYGLCNQIFSLIVAVGKVYNNTMIPRYAALRLKKEKEKIQELFSISTVIYWGFCLIALSGMLMFGNSALDILKPGFYIPPILMILMALMHYFDGYSNLSTMVISTGNTVPYMKATIISSIGIIISYFIFLEVIPLGMYGLIISKFVVQTFYMNWKWPLEIMKEFELNGTKCIKIGFSSIYNISRKEKNII